MTQLESIIIDGIKYVREDNKTEIDINVLKYCIVRCKNAGVHSGYVVERKGTEVKLVKSRRLWRWFGRTLSGLAIEGTLDVSRCKFGDELEEIEVLDACEVIPCTEAATKSLRFDVPKWEND